jgi:hypothetical protein
VGYLLAGAISVGIACIEVSRQLKTRRTIRGKAWAWWASRLLIEGIVGAAALYGLRNMTNLSWANDVRGCVAAGFGGPTIVRSRFMTIPISGIETPIGLATFYDVARLHFQQGLERVGAQRDARWVQRDVLPALEGGSNPKELGETIISVVKRMQDHEPRVAFVLAIMDDTIKPDREKLKDLVDYACCELGAFQLIEDAYKDAVAGGGTEGLGAL